MIRRALAVGAVMALAASTPAFAQGSGSASPISWVDDATVLESGGVAIAISTLRWSGSGVSELNAPVLDVALGLTSRVQLSASVPRIVGSADPGAAAGGLGTAYFSSKIRLLDHEKRGRGAKLAVSPTLEVLSPGVTASLAPGEHRVQVGFPVSAEIDRGAVHVYAATGYFTRGAWFTGGGAGIVVNDKTAVSGGISRSWRRAVVPGVPLGDRDRNEISGSVSYAVAPSVRAFGSLSRTIATLAENGAGTTIGGGISFFFTAPVK